MTLATPPTAPESPRLLERANDPRESGATTTSSDGDHMNGQRPFLVIIICSNGFRMGEGCQWLSA
jgi:hypothetical protein